MKNKIQVLLGMLVLVFWGVTAAKPGKPVHENLKVLPKDISNADLDSVMSGFERSLGVTCEFCHAKSKINAAEMDWPSDEKPEKEITRKMMRLTEMINKEFFNYTITYTANELMAVSCKTCHGGKPRPELKEE
jgi:hypothetical protein